MFDTESESSTESVLNLRTLRPARLHLFRRPRGERSCRGERPCGRGERAGTSGDGDKNFDSVRSSDTSVVSTGSCSFIEPSE